MIQRVNFPPVNHIEIRDGQAYIAGRNVKVKMVISRLIHGTGATFEEVMEQYNLTSSEVHSVIPYYYNHKVEIDRYFVEEERFAREHIPSLEALKARLQKNLNNLTEN
jgi:uncharacterized protein (DUF433 family)